MTPEFKEYSKDVITALHAISWESVRRMTDVIRRARNQNSTVYILGNGGSAATASHFANDLLKMGKLRAVALPEMVPAVTAYGNDDGWDDMFSHLLKVMLLPQDVVVGISCSGFSSNVINAIEMAKTINLPRVKTIVLTGDTGEAPLVQLEPDVIVHVPFADIRVQEDCHLVICHAVAGGLK